MKFGTKQAKMRFLAINSRLSLHMDIVYLISLLNCWSARGGRARKGMGRKGMGRNFRLGEGNCTIDTVVGAIGYYYAGKQPGDSVFDPVFVMAAILDWAGIAHNRRGYLELTANYRASRQC